MIVFAFFGIRLNKIYIRNHMYRAGNILSQNILSRYDKDLFLDYGLLGYDISKINIDEYLFESDLSDLNIEILETLNNPIKFVENANEFTILNLGMNFIENADKKLGVFDNVKQISKFLNKKSKVDRNLYNLYSKYNKLNLKYEKMIRYFVDNVNSFDDIDSNMIDKYFEYKKNMMKISEENFQLIDDIKKFENEIGINFYHNNEDILNSKIQFEEGYLDIGVKEFFQYMDRLKSNDEKSNINFKKNNEYKNYLKILKKLLDNSTDYEIKDNYEIKNNYFVEKKYNIEFNDYEDLKELDNLNILDHIVFDEFILGVFLDSVNSDNHETFFTERCKNKVGDEVEYIIYGKSSGNSEICKLEIFNIRILFNAISIFSIKELRDQVHILANAGSVIVKIPSKILEPIIIMGWAVFESKFDLKELCSGSGVYIFKFKYDDWNTKFKILKSNYSVKSESYKLNLTKDDKFIEGKWNFNEIDSIKLYYDDYLRFFLKKIPIEKKIYRCKQIIKNNYFLKKGIDLKFNNLVVKHKVNFKYNFIKDIVSEY